MSSNKLQSVFKVGDEVKIKGNGFVKLKKDKTYIISKVEDKLRNYYLDESYTFKFITEVIDKQTNEAISCCVDPHKLECAVFEKCDQNIKKLKVGDVVKLSKLGVEHFSKEGWKAYRLPRAIYEGKKATVYDIDDFGGQGIRIHVEVEGEGSTFFFAEMVELTVEKNKTEVEKPTSALDKQVSGNHYKDCGIQPIEYIHANGLDYFEGNVIKYTTRHSKKNGKADIEKAIHYLEMILELKYKDK